MGKPEPFDGRYSSKQEETKREHNKRSISRKDLDDQLNIKIEEEDKPYSVLKPKRIVINAIVRKNVD